MIDAAHDPARHGHTHRRHLWVIIAVFLLVGGVAASVIGAMATARNDAAASHRTFEASSSQVVSTLRLAIQHEADLVVNESAFIRDNPHATNDEFLAWTKSVRLSERYPEMMGTGAVTAVPNAKLAAGYECLPSLIFSVLPVDKVPTDLCATPVGPLILQARDTGVGAYFPYQVGGYTLLGIQTPIYSDLDPPTVAARRATFVAWAGNAIDANTFLTGALKEHPGLVVSMDYDQGASKVAFLSGTVPKHAQSISVDLNNGWTIKTFRAPVATGALSDFGALVVLISGIATSLLLAALVLVLATGRERAMRMVTERTGELRYQALHDALTGLPNRTLIADRIEQLLSRDRRQGTLGAALYVDLDEFKIVNDTLGHETGDRLLVAVASRLTNVLRGSDTIGRMGGDEFIVLVDSTAIDVSPEVVAERVLEALRQPFTLEGVAIPLTVTASVGIASGDRASASELLRDADVALYEAKAAGKNRYAFFNLDMHPRQLIGSSSKPISTQP